MTLLLLLAFAIEGQVKEKSRWFSSLRDMTRKLKVQIRKLENQYNARTMITKVLKNSNLQIMKMEHLKLSEEASLYKNSIMDINEIGTTILSRSKLAITKSYTYL